MTKSSQELENVGGTVSPPYPSRKKSLEKGGRKKERKLARRVAARAPHLLHKAIKLKSW